ncbi:MAG: M48 family metallopeptidase [Candidatus Izimaplasma sp.]|nr:M48 family metallopeptidase [Candidatus Izimaplasma bacterium]
METVIMIIVYLLVIGVFLFNMWLSFLNYKNKDATIPDVVSDVYDTKSYKKWKEYNMATFKFGIVTKTINLVIFLVLLASGLFVKFEDLSEQLFSTTSLQILIFLGIYYLIHFIIGIITDYYKSFVIEETYGFNKKTHKTFIKDKIKSFILTIVFGGGLIYLLFTLFENTGAYFILYAWISLVVIFIFVNMFYTTLIVPLFNKLTPLEDGELREKIIAFSEGVGYEVKSISVMDASRRSTKLNAFFSGFGRMKKIVLFDTLIDKMSDEEVVAVLAHEVGHSKHKHIIFNIVQTIIMLSVYVGLFALLLNLPIFNEAFGFDSVNFGFTLILFFILINPLTILVSLFTNTLSRKYEYQADEFAAANFNKEDMESALKLLARENFSNLTPHGLYVKFHYSHPPVAKRISAIRKVVK